MRTVTFNEERLKYLYDNTKLPLEKIAEDLGISNSTLYSYLKDNNLGKRKSKCVDVEKLKDMFLNKNMSLNSIAKALDISIPTVNKYLKELNLERKGNEGMNIVASTLDLENLKDLYVNQMLPIEVISEKLKVNTSTLYCILRKNEISRPRLVKSNPDGRPKTKTKKKEVKSEVNKDMVAAKFVIDSPDIKESDPVKGLISDNLQSLLDAGKAKQKKSSKPKQSKKAKEVALTSASGEKQKRASSSSIVQEETDEVVEYTREEKIAYCNEKYGRGNWRFMGREEFLSAMMYDFGK